MSGFAAIKRQARRAVHKRFAVAGLYTDADLTDVPVMCRYHSRLVQHGAIHEDGYAEVLDNITRLVFQEDELAATLPAPFLPVAGAVVTLTDYGLAFTLDSLVPADGPANVTWEVSRRRS